MDLSLGLIFFGLVIASFLAMAFLSLIFKTEGMAKWMLGQEAALDVMFSLSIFGLVGSTTGMFVVAFSAVVFTVYISIAHEAYGDRKLRWNGCLRGWLNGEDVELWSIEETDGIGLPQAIKKRLGAFGSFLWRLVK
jgi:hypothetical protein